MSETPSNDLRLRPDDKGFQYVMLWMDHCLKQKVPDADASFLIEWRQFILDCRADLRATQAKLAEVTTKRDAEIHDIATRTSLLTTAETIVMYQDASRRMREAEAKLEAAELEIEKCCAAFEDVSAELNKVGMAKEEAESALARAQGDARRLDALQNWAGPDLHISVWRTLLGVWLVDIGNGEEFEAYEDDRLTDGHRTIREAIDAAMSSGGAG